MSLSISHWNFSSPNHTLDFRFELIGHHPITSITSQGIDDQGLAVFVLASPPSMTTTIRFLGTALVDGVEWIPIGISFAGVSYLVLRSPHFYRSLQYDPDISVTLGEGGDGQDLKLLALLSLLLIPLTLVVVATVGAIAVWMLGRSRAINRHHAVNYNPEDDAVDSL